LFYCFGHVKQTGYYYYYYYYYYYGNRFVSISADTSAAVVTVVDVVDQSSSSSSLEPIVHCYRNERTPEVENGGDEDSGAASAFTPDEFTRPDGNQLAMHEVRLSTTVPPPPPPHPQSAT
jgi:hypothetical protein